MQPIRTFFSNAWEMAKSAVSAKPSKLDRAIEIFQNTFITSQSVSDPNQKQDLFRRAIEQLSDINDENNEGDERVSKFITALSQASGVKAAAAKQIIMLQPVQAEPIQVGEGPSNADLQAKEIYGLAKQAMDIRMTVNEKIGLLRRANEELDKFQPTEQVLDYKTKLANLIAFYVPQSLSPVISTSTSPSPTPISTPSPAPSELANVGASEQKPSEQASPQADSSTVTQEPATVGQSVESAPPEAPPAPADLGTVTRDPALNVPEHFSQQLRKAAAAKIRQMNVSQDELQKLSVDQRIDSYYQKAFLDAAREMRPDKIPEHDWEFYIDSSNAGNEDILRDLGWDDAHPNLKDFIRGEASDKHYINRIFPQAKPVLSEKAQKIAEKFAKGVSQSASQARLGPSVSAQDIGKVGLKPPKGEKKPLFDRDAAIAARRPAIQDEEEIGPGKDVEELLATFATPNKRVFATGHISFDNNDIARVKSDLKNFGRMPSDLAQLFRETGVPNVKLVKLIAQAIQGLPNDDQEQAFGAFSPVQQVWLLEQITDGDMVKRYTEFFAHNFTGVGTTMTKAVEIYLKEHKSDGRVGNLYTSLQSSIAKARREASHS